MKTSLPLGLLLCFFASCSIASVYASGKHSIPVHSFNDSLAKKEKEFEVPSKICVCQVLQLESTNHRVRNYALYAERTNRKSFTYDVHKAKWILEKEKKHLADFFYDKLNVLDDLMEVSDCKSMFIKMKKKHRTLILYDILDADIKR